MSHKQNNLLYFFVGTHYGIPVLILLGAISLIFALIAAIILITAYF